MKNLEKQLITSILTAILLSGCATHSSPSPEKIKKGKKSEIEVELNSPERDELTKKLIKISEDLSKQYRLFMMRDDKLKKNIPRHKIPAGMAKRLDISFEGYELILLKKVVEKAGYRMKLKKISVLNSPVVSKKYRSTRIVDIVEDISNDLKDFDISIDEKNRIVTVKIH